MVGSIAGLEAYASVELDSAAGTGAASPRRDVSKLGSICVTSMVRERTRTGRVRPANVFPTFNIISEI